MSENWQILRATSKELEIYKKKISEGVKNALDKAILETNDPIKLAQFAANAANEITFAYCDQIGATGVDCFNNLYARKHPLKINSQVYQSMVDVDVSEFEKLAEKGITVPKLIDRCTNLAQVQANRVYGKAFDECAKKIGKKVKYARVAFGTTCSYCLMLASRDHDYNSAESAMRCSHAHCDCMVKPEDVKVPEYDPEKLKEQWRETSTNEIVSKGLKGSSEDMVKEVKEKYPMCYDGWQNWCNKKHQIFSKQQKHIQGTKMYIDACEDAHRKNTIEPSYFFALTEKEINKLVMSTIGKGHPKPDNLGMWKHAYYVTFDKAVGYNASTNTPTRTIKVTCRDNGNLHGFPTEDEGLEPDVHI